MKKALAISFLLLLAACKGDPIYDEKTVSGAIMCGKFHIDYYDGPIEEDIYGPEHYKRTIRYHSVILNSEITRTIDRCEIIKFDKPGKVSVIVGYEK